VLALAQQIRVQQQEYTEELHRFRQGLCVHAQCELILSNVKSFRRKEVVHESAATAWHGECQHLQGEATRLRRLAEAVQAAPALEAAVREAKREAEAHPADTLPSGGAQRGHGNQTRPRRISAGPGGVGRAEAIRLAAAASMGALLPLTVSGILRGARSPTSALLASGVWQAPPLLHELRAAAAARQGPAMSSGGLRITVLHAAGGGRRLHS